MTLIQQIRMDPLELVTPEQDRDNKVNKEILLLINKLQEMIQLLIKAQIQVLRLKFQQLVQVITWNFQYVWNMANIHA